MEKGLKIFMNGLTKISVSRTIIYVVLIMCMALQYVTLGIDDDPGAYWISMLFVVVVSIAYISLAICDSIRGRNMRLIIGILSLALLVLALLETIPYLKYTTVQGYSLSYGSVDYYGSFEKTIDIYKQTGNTIRTADTTERAIPVVLSVGPSIIFIITILNSIKFTAVKNK